MKASKMKVPGGAAVATVARQGANDAARCQTGNKNVNRYCAKGPHVPNPHNMKGGY